MPEPTNFVERYKAEHRHPVNQACHTIGIPMIVVSLLVAPFRPAWGAALFIVGWIFQFVGHYFEGNKPAFFGNPIYLLVGPIWLLKKMAGRVRGQP